MAPAALNGTDLRRILTAREHQVLVLLARERGRHANVAEILRTHVTTVAAAERSAREKIERAKARRAAEVSVRSERDTADMRVPYADRVEKVRELLTDRGPMRAVDLRDELGVETSQWSGDMLPRLKADGVLVDTGALDRKSPVLRLGSDTGAGQDDGEVSPVSEPPTAAEPESLSAAGPVADHGAAEDESVYVCELCDDDILNRQPFVESPDGSRSHQVCVTNRAMREEAERREPPPPLTPEEDAAFDELPHEDVDARRGVLDEIRDTLDPGGTNEALAEQVTELKDEIPGNGHGPQAAVWIGARDEASGKLRDVQARVESLHRAHPGPAFGPGPIARILSRMVEDLRGYAVIDDATADNALSELRTFAPATREQRVVEVHFEYLGILFELAREPGAPQHVFDRIERLMVEGPPHARGADDAEGRQAAAPVLT